MAPRQSSRIKNNSHASVSAPVPKPSALIGFQVAVRYNDDRYLACLHAYRCSPQGGNGGCLYAGYYRAHLNKQDIVFLTPDDAWKAVQEFDYQKSLRLCEWCDGRPFRSSEGSLQVWGEVTDIGKILQLSCSRCDADKNKSPPKPTGPTPRNTVLTLSGADYHLLSSTNPPITPDIMKRLGDEKTRLKHTLSSK